MHSDCSAGLSAGAAGTRPGAARDPTVQPDPSIATSVAVSRRKTRPCALATQTVSIPVVRSPDGAVVQRPATSGALAKQSRPESNSSRNRGPHAGTFAPPSPRASSLVVREHAPIAHASNPSAVIARRMASLRLSRVGIRASTRASSAAITLTARCPRVPVVLGRGVSAVAGARKEDLARPTSLAALASVPRELWRVRVVAARVHVELDRRLGGTARP